jgi:hypothetical protein
MFRVSPLKYIKLNVAMMEMGMATLIMVVVPILRRKIYRMNIASKIPKSAVRSTSLMAISINSA